MSYSRSLPCAQDTVACRAFHTALGHLTTHALSAEQAKHDLDAMADAVELGALAQRGDATKGMVLEAVAAFKERQSSWPLDTARALGGT